MILLVTRSSTEPSLFHAGCRPILNVGLLQHLYLTYSLERHSTHIHLGRNTSYHSDGRLSPRLEHILPQWWNIFAHSPRMEHILPQWWTTLTQAGTHPTTMMNDSHPGRNTSYHNDERFLHLHSPRPEHILPQWWKGLHLHPPRREHILPQWWKGLHSYLIL